MLRDCPEEVGFAHCRGSESDIRRRILEEDGAFDRLLDLVDVIAHLLERLFCVRQRQEVVKERSAVGGPRQLLGYQRGLLATHRMAKAREMSRIQRAPAAARPTHAANAER